MTNLWRFRDFVRDMTCLVEETGNDESRIFADGKVLLAELVSHDDWLPDDFARANPDRYQQLLLHCDPLERFSVVSFVWGPGQQTPIHDHTVWGMVGQMRGAECCEEFALDASNGRLVAEGKHRLEPGGVDLVSPRVGDIHRVSNALEDAVSVSVHVYGANIGAVDRHIYDPRSGSTQQFISGYSTSVVPNIWDRSLE